MKKQTWMAVASVAVFLNFTADSARAQGDIGELQERFNDVKQVVDDPLTDEGGIRKAHRELEQMAKMTQDFEEGDLTPDNPKASLAKGIIDTLHQVESRLPAQFGQRFEERPGFPVPIFDRRELLAKLAGDLHGAQQALARNVRKQEAPGNQTEKFLHEVTKAQENLAWEAGWPYTKEEASQVREGGRARAKAYESRLLRGIERINEQIAIENQSNGRDDERPFVIHQSASDEGKERFTKHLEELRQVNSLPKNGVREFDEEEANALKGRAARKGR